MADGWEDREAIRELASNYAAAASLMDTRAMQLVFTDDARVSGVTEATGGQGDLVGPQAICDYFGRLFDGIEHLTQMPHTANVAVAGDTATATCDIVEYVKHPGVAGFTIVVGHYDDQLRRTSQGWRFCHRALSFRIFQRVPEALM
jgi:ketosteroid isomerase-like protein